MPVASGWVICAVTTLFGVSPLAPTNEIVPLSVPGFADNTMHDLARFATSVSDAMIGDGHDDAVMGPERSALVSCGSAAPPTGRVTKFGADTLTLPEVTLNPAVLTSNRPFASNVPATVLVPTANEKNGAACCVVNV